MFLVKHSCVLCKTPWCFD